MSLPINNLVEALQASRIDLETNINDPSNYGKMTGTLNWMFSAQNPTTIETQMGSASRDGKYKPVQISYLPKKGNTDVITSSASLNCDKTAMRREASSKRTQNLTFCAQQTLSSRRSRG